MTFHTTTILNGYFLRICWIPRWVWTKRLKDVILESCKLSLEKNQSQRLSRACIVHLVIKRTNWSYVKTMSCSGSHLGTITTNNNGRRKVMVIDLNELKVMHKFKPVTYIQWIHWVNWSDSSVFYVKIILLKQRW
jgi:hypothetical protein